MVNTSNAAFFEQSAEGWHWYQDPPIIEPSKEPAPTVAPKITNPTELVKAYRQELEKKLHLAWVAPTPKNVQDYQEMQRDLMQRSENFSKTWMQVVYQNPHLDHTLVAPVNQKARHIYLDQEKNRTAGLIQSLKEKYGLFFFFSGQCEYCHQFAPIVQQFANKYGWQVIAISVDGGVVPGFKEILPDNGLVAKWKVSVLPALFAVDPKTEHVLPIAYGLTALDQMEERIKALVAGQ
jgi:conjugal transfer pilus assembly protein TraF